MSESGGYKQHGGRHGEQGSDLIPVVWRDLSLEGGWTVVDGKQARYCVLPGRHIETGDVKIELELSVEGGDAGSLIATLPYTFDADKPPFPALDGSGNLQVITVLADGSIMDGYY